MAATHRDTAEDGADERQVRVSFYTKQEAYRVTTQPFNVPSRLKRYGLSEVINHLLELSTAVPFDFLVNGEFLRTSLDAYLISRGLNSETILDIEYFEAFPPPTPQHSYKHDDWLACCGTASLPGSTVFLTGLYDNRLHAWNESGACIATGEGHTAAIKDLAVSGDAVVTASQDETLRSWTLERGKGGQQKLVPTAIFRGIHTGFIDAVCMQPNAPPLRKFCSGSWDSTIALWDTEGRSVDENLVAPTKKKQKISSAIAEQLPTREALAVLSGHTAPVTSTVWTQKDQIFSGGMDNCVREWDVESGVNTATLNGPKAVLRIAYSEDTQLLASGSSDGHVRLWDSRVRDGTVVKMALASHTGWVSSVAWSPQNSYQLVSGSYDCSVKVWDTRSRLPLMTLAQNDAKVLCVDWSSNYILSGGADSRLHIHSTVSS